MKYKLSPIEKDLETVKKKINRSNEYLENHPNGLFANRHKRNIENLVIRRKTLLTHQNQTSRLAENYSKNTGTKVNNISTTTTNNVNYKSNNYDRKSFSAFNNNRYTNKSKKH